MKIYQDENAVQYQPEIIETPGKEIEQLFQIAEAYSKTTIQLARLKSLEVTTIIVTSLVTKVVVASVVFLFLIVLNIGVSIYLGQIFDNAYSGFFLVAGFNLFIAVLLYFFLHTWIKKKLGLSIIKQFLD